MLISSPDIGFRNFDPKIHLEANFGPKSQRCPFCLKNGTHGISSMLILIPNYFSEFQILISFLGKFGPKKVKVVRFNWKLVHMLSWKCRFRIRTWIFEIPIPKFIFGQIWVEKIKVVCFSWKLARMASWQCWFLFQL